MPVGFLKSCRAAALVIVASGGCGGQTSNNGEPAGSRSIAGASGNLAGGINGAGGSSGIAGTNGSFTIGGVTGITGGSINVGGTPTTDTSNCSNNTSSTPCGGKVVGRWIVYSGNLSISGDMDVSLLGLGCASVRANGCLQVGGIWSAYADGTYDDGTYTGGNVTFTLAPACLSISSVPVDCAKVGPVFGALGWASTTCSSTQGACVCTAMAAQKGGLGVMSSPASANGNYATTGNTLTLDDITNYSYCVSGQKLTLTPIGTGTTGTLELWMNGSTGGAMNNG